jgi:hypothetical protein
VHNNLPRIILRVRKPNHQKMAFRFERVVSD